MVHVFATTLRRAALEPRFSPSARLLTSSSSSALLDIGRQHVNKGLAKRIDGIVQKAEGPYLFMQDGRRLLDFSCGIGVTNLGHCHPKISKAAADQCMQVTHAQCSIVFHEPYLRLIQKLLPIMPDSSLDSFFFWNSGSEAVEAAIKMARALTNRQNIITMQGGYHGRTFGAMALTSSKTSYSEGFAPLMPGVFNTPFPYWHQLALPPSTNEEELVTKSLYQLDLRLKQQTAPADTAAILIEPVLGEGGYVPAPAAFLQGLRKVCDKHDILLIVDEVQTGFGRTGKYFSVEHSGVCPDILIVAKGLANGFPLSGIISRRELTDKLRPDSLGGTYAGNAVSCAAAIAVADAFVEEKILENVQTRSWELFDALRKLRDDSTIGPNILDIRGQGLMIGIEFASPSGSQFDPFIRPSAPGALANRIAKKCLDKGLVLLTTSAYEVIRFIPPLNITQAELGKGLDIFIEASKDVMREG